MTTRSSVPASTWARLAKAAAAAAVDTEAAVRLREDPARSVRDLFDLDISAMAATDRSDCSVAGRYYEKQGLIKVDTTVARVRQNFTILHELGHHLLYLIDEVADLIEKLADPDDAAAAEEDFADAFAATLLLPDSLVGRYIGSAGPTADDLLALHRDAETASREACAVAAVQRLPRSGYVIVAELDGTVRFAARTNTPYPIARDTRQPDSILARAGREGRAHDDRAVLRYRTGQETEPHSGQAVSDGRYVFGVFTTGRPPWELGVWIPNEDLPSRREVECVSDPCGHVWEPLGRACRNCHDHRCPKCNRCGCDVDEPDEVICRGSCGLLVRVERTIDGICNDCR